MADTTHLLADGFISKLLEPLPGGIPVDTQYNAMMRRARWGAYRNAECEVEYFKALCAFLDAKATRSCTPPDEAAELRDQRIKALREWRKAVATLIRTPARRLEDVAWKERAAKDEYLPIGPEEIAEAIDADRTFFAAHPVNSRRGRAGKARSN